MKCPTHLISDAPESSDSFGPHKRIADAIVELLQTEKGGKSIGLEGNYGSGKTTVVNLINSELKDDNSFLLIPFDVWAHEGDPLRRTFLETLIREVNGKQWINEKDWKRKLDIIAQRREEKTTKSIPQLKPIAKAVGVSLFFIPFGIAFLNAAARDLVSINPNLPVSWKFVIGSILTTSPLLVFLIWWLAASILGKPSENKSKDDSLWALLFTKTITEEQSEETKTPNPTSIEFEDTFKELMREALSETNRRVLLVLDNLDRVEPDDALSIWATLQTFLQHSPYSSEDWFERLWVLVLYDPEGIGRLWEKSETTSTIIIHPDRYNFFQNPENTKRAVTPSFLDKSFQSRFVVPPPALSDWHSHLTMLLKEALPEHSDEDFHEIYRVLATHSAKEKIAPTIRRLKLYVNQIGTIHRQWQHTFPLSHVAYYVLFQGEGANTIEWFLRHPEEAYKGFIDESLRESLAALAFNIEKERALQFLLSDRIRDALSDADAYKLREYAKFHGGFWEVLEGVIQGHGDWRDGRWGKILNAAYCIDQSHILDNSERPQEAKSVVKELVNAASDVDRWGAFDERKARGVAALCRWHQDKNFALKLLKAIPESLFLLRSEDYKSLDVGNLIKGLKALRSEFENFGLVEVYSNGVVEPLKSRLNKDALDPNHPTISAETNALLEVLFELHHIDVEANQYLNELIKDTGYLLHRLQSAISQLASSVANEVAGAVSWCLFILLRAYPDATKQSIFLRWQEQRDLLLSFLQQKSFEQNDANTPAEAEATKQQSEVVRKNIEAVTGNFIHVLLKHEEASLLFRILDAEPEAKPFVVRCILYLVKDTGHAKSLFTPEVLIERWSFLYHEFAGSDSLSPTLFDTLIQRLSWDSGLVKVIYERGFDPEQAGLYKALAINLGESDHQTQDFRLWCVLGLQSINRDMWGEELRNPKDLLRLALFLSARGISLDLGDAYKEALLEHSKLVIAGIVAQDFIGGNPIMARHPLGKMADPLGLGVTRKDFRNQLYELVINADGEIDEKVFFDIYEEEISDLEILMQDDRTFSRLFIPLLNRRKTRAMQWVANVLASYTRQAGDYPYLQSMAEFEKRIKTVLEEGAFDEAAASLNKIAEFLDGSVPSERQTEDLAAHQGKCSNCGNKYSFTKWDMSGEPICPYCAHPLVDMSDTVGKVKSQEQADKIRRLQFRNKRLQKMIAGQTLTDLPLDDHPWIILHMIPTVVLESSNIDAKFDLSALAPEMVEVPAELLLFRPIATPDVVIGGKLDGEGLITYTRNTAKLNQGSSRIKSQVQETESAYSYLRIFSDGTIEAVRATYYRTGKRRLPERFKRDLLEAISRYLTIQQHIGVQSPISIILTLTGLKEHSPKETPILLPEVLIPSFEYQEASRLATLLEPIVNKIPVAAIDKSY